VLKTRRRWKKKNRGGGYGLFGLSKKRGRAGGKVLAWRSDDYKLGVIQIEKRKLLTAGGRRRMGFKMRVLRKFNALPKTRQSKRKGSTRVDGRKRRLNRQRRP